MAARKTLIFGNSGSGKSTLARELAKSNRLAHLDLDDLAWIRSDPPSRRDLEDSGQDIHSFVQDNHSWVIEGCYTDLLELAEPHSTEIVFLDIPIDDCITNARNRPWEPHKYESKESQDQNLEMLIGWIKDYKTRDDVLSWNAHNGFYQNYSRKKQLITSNDQTLDDG